MSFLPVGIVVPLIAELSVLLIRAAGHRRAALVV
jgi:hypothetical protein